MGSQKIVGIVLIVVGVAVVLWGYNVSSPLSGQVGQALTGSSSTKAIVAFVVGLVCIVLGIEKSKVTIFSLFWVSLRSGCLRYNTEVSDCFYRLRAINSQVRI